MIERLKLLIVIYCKCEPNPQTVKSKEDSNEGYLIDTRIDV